MNYYQSIPTSDPPQISSNEIAIWNGTSWEITNYPRTVTWDVIRGHRDFLLMESDWTVLPDTNVANKQAWLDYRQALRNVPQNFPNPLSVVWPQKP